MPDHSARSAARRSRPDAPRRSPQDSDPHIDPRRLAVLLAVQREGGIVAAADILHVSASAVSQQIQRLEDEVGLDLIERTPAGAVPTPAGRLLAASAERIEAELTDAARALRPLTGQVTGEVAIASMLTVIKTVLVPFASDLSRAAPGIDLHLHESDEIPGMANLRAGRFDLLTIERDAAPERTPAGFTDTPFFGEPWVLATPESAPVIGSERDLAQLQWLRTMPATAGARAIERIIGAIDQPKIVEDSYINYDVALAMVAAGRGSTVLPRLALAGGPPPGVRAVPLPGLGARRLYIRHRTATSGRETPTGQALELLLHWTATHAIAGDAPLQG